MHMGNWKHVSNPIEANGEMLIYGILKYSPLSGTGVKGLRFWSDLV